ncbi:MAG: cysteine desulfurase-like protein [Planctomycetes bacterium]|nr:cysteine desulfurase-like protein [Planctomycetota bacterium]
MTVFDPASVRPLFPPLARAMSGRPVVFADGPGGTQVPTAVVSAMTAYLQQSNANTGGRFATSQETGAVVARARAAAAALLNASADEIVFGQNMTSLTFSMSRAIARTWKPGDEVVVTALDHDANVAPWMLAAEDRGAVVRTLPFTLPDCSLSVDALTALIGPRTRLVALGYASNGVGSIVDLIPLIAAAHRVGALVFVDAVHYAPHGVIDVRALDCDFLACSAYKFCGPHVGILYAKQKHLEALTAYKVRPSTMVAPGKWETGTQNFEALAGLSACVAYLGSLAGSPVGSPTATAERDPFARSTLVAAMERIAAHERTLSARFLEAAARIPGLRVHGIADPARAAERTPTFGITLASAAPHQAAERLCEHGVFVWDGHFYAKGLVDQLGLADAGGLLRIGFAHYNTVDEIDRVVSELQALAR